MAAAGTGEREGGRSRPVSPENPAGGKGAGGGAAAGTGAAAARDPGPGWKVSPSVEIAAGGTHAVAEVAGPGVIRHMWLAVPPARLRPVVLRAYRDGAAGPAIAVPVGDLFCQGWASFAQVSSIPVAVNPHGGLNSYWEMPFRSQARVTLENLGQAAVTVYYQVDYELTEVPEAAGYLHAAWRRSNPLQAGQVHTIIDGI